jgi:tight adherence protein B
MLKKFRFLLIGFVIVGTTISLSFPSSFAADPNQKSIEFLIDTSGSMGGTKIEGVKVAVKTIVESIPSDIEVGLITFSSKAKVLVPLTTDRKVLLAAISNLRASGQTAIFDAIKLGIESMKSITGSRIILLTDGEDTVSNQSLKKLLESISLKQIPVDSIGLQTNEKQGQTLNSISSSSGGTFYPLNSIDQLIAAYQKSLESIILPTPVATPVVTPPAIVYTSKFLGFDWRLAPYIIAGQLFFIIFFLLLLIRKITSIKRIRKERWIFLEKYELRKLKTTATLRITKNINYDAIPPRIQKWIKTRLELVHSEMVFEKVIKLLLLAYIISTLLFLFIFKNIIFAAILGAIVTPLLFDKYTQNLHKKHIRLFADELPDFLNIAASALRAGLTFAQGLEAFSLENNGEVARQIRRATTEIQMGATIEGALMDVAIRMNNEDLKWTVTALSIQRNVGGSLATILSTTFTTVKERAEVRREVRTLSAEGKLSAYILMALPVGIFFFLFLTKRDYVSIFWTELAGFLLLGLIAAALTVGWIWIKKIIEIKI